MRHDTFLWSIHTNDYFNFCICANYGVNDCLPFFAIFVVLFWLLQCLEIALEIAKKLDQKVPFLKLMVITIAETIAGV